MLLLALACMASFGGTRRRYGRDVKKEDVLDQQTRNAIYELIRSNEGLHFRRICRALDKKMGVIQYHTSVLEKNGLIRAIRDGRYKCFFVQEQASNVSPEDRPSEEEKALREIIIASLRRKTPKVLISHLAKEKSASHQTLSTVAEVSPQAITFHCSRLQQFNIITSQKEGRQKFYMLSESARKITDKLLR